MEYWEFLLQQEGDHHWLPLDTAQMEILEGRYRIMAHTSAANTPVRVQVSQRLLDQDPPKRRSFKRQGQTNAEGLMVVIPFTRIQAGTWDIRCSSLPTDADSSPEVATADPASPVAPPDPAWAYRVQLQVLPPGGEDDEVWTLPPADDTFLPMPRSGVARPARLDLDLDLDLESIAAALDQAQSDLATGDALPGWRHRLRLTQTALVGQEGAEVDLAGHLTSTQAGEPCGGMVLVVRLVDPQTATAVALTPVALEAATLPADFHLAIPVPPHLETRLLLGELALVQTTPPTVLALQRFTLTVDLAALFDTIANQAEAKTDYVLDFAGGSGPGQRVSGEPKEDPNPNPNRPLDLPQGPPRSMPVFTLPRDGQRLPPQLYQPSPHEVSARQPTLPPFGPAPRRSQSAPPGDTEVADPPAPEPSSPPPPGEAVEPEAAAPTQGERPTLSLPPLTPPAADPPASNSAPKPPTVPLLPSHEAAGFRDLKLQERFWSRLNQMAVSLQQEALDRRHPQDTATEDKPPETLDEPTASPLPPEPFAGEVVIYEDEDETLGRQGDVGQDDAPPAEVEPLVPPLPDLDIPGGELVAGAAVLLTLRVPFHPNRIYLKVWITDPQTRSLVDEPRQVMNLHPNGHGQLEGTVQLTVPFGCLEAEFEAITVDMITQQESYKTTVSRTIVPAEVSTSDLSDLDDLEL